MASINKKLVTEKRNPKSTKIDEMKTEEILSVINSEDKKVAKAVEKEIKNIKKAVNITVENMRNNGRIIYIGAGTSGRLGILDAAECKPTFKIEDGKVIGILAGGKEAMFESKENVEDDKKLGAERISSYDLNKNDTVFGITASGRTPFVLGAVKEARKNNNFIVGLSCTENSKLSRLCDVAISPIVGPEVLTGSTRMKAGTAQKMVLNMFSTTVMIKLGKVYCNLMVDLNPQNEKLRNRAQEIFNIITSANKTDAKKFLEKANYNLKEAIVMYEKNINRDEAKKVLKDNNGILRNVLG